MLISSSGLSEIMTWITGLSTGLAVVAASVCLIRYMIAGESNALAAAKDDLKIVAISWILINSVRLITQAAITLANNFQN